MASSPSTNPAIWAVQFRVLPHVAPPLIPLKDLARVLGLPLQGCDSLRRAVGERYRCPSFERESKASICLLVLNGVVNSKIGPFLIFFGNHCVWDHWSWICGSYLRRLEVVFAWKASDVVIPDGYGYIFVMVDGLLFRCGSSLESNHIKKSSL